MHRKIQIFLRELVFGDPQIQFFGPLRGIFEGQNALRAAKGRGKAACFFPQKTNVNAPWPALFPTAFSLLIIVNH